MGRWALRRKNDRKFRSRRAYKQDAMMDSEEEWEKRKKPLINREMKKCKF